MKRYFVRSVKFAIYLFVIIFVVVMFIYFMSKDVMAQEASLWKFFGNGRLLELLCVIVVFGAIYPAFGYVTVKIHQNKPLDENKNHIIDLFNDRKYELTDDENKVLIFRPKSSITRLFRMNEDALEIDYSDTTLKFHGLRRDVYKFKFMLEAFAREDRD